MMTTAAQTPARTVAVTNDRSGFTVLGGTAIGFASLLFLAAAMAPSAMHAMMGAM